MALTPYSGDTSIIGKLGTTPQERGLTTQQFKDKFDEGLKAFVEWFNDTHLDELQLTGTWTPTINATSVPGTPTYILQNGSYYKIGKLVVANMQLRISNKGGMEGNLYIGGLPFTPTGSSAVVLPSYYGVMLPSGKILSGLVMGNAIELRYADNTSGSNLTAADISDDFAIWIATFVYIEQ